MAEDTTHVFTYTWKIHNYELNGKNDKGFIESPIFNVETLERSEWKIKLFPKNGDGFVECFLCAEACKDSIIISFEFTVLTTNRCAVFVKKRAHNCTFDKENSELGFRSFVEHVEFLNVRKSILSNGALTIRCRLWRGKPAVVEKNAVAAEPAEENYISSENTSMMYFGDTMPRSRGISNKSVTTNSRQHSTISPQSSKAVKKFKCMPFANCFAQTYIRVEKLKFVVSIENFQSWEENEIIYITIQHESASLFLYLSDDDNIIMKIEQFDRVDPLALKCKIYIIDCEDKRYCFFEDFNQNTMWEVNTSINKKNILSEKRRYMTNDKLILHFEFSSSSGAYSHTVRYDADPLFNDNCDDVAHITYLYSSGSFSDVTLRADDKCFAVHKSILGAQSPVFEAMFKHDMKEKNENVVDIADVDNITLGRMLSVMYSTPMHDLDFKSALDLYVASDKYQFLKLKDQCAQSIKVELTPSNACEALLFANSYNDEDLTNVVIGYVAENTNSVLSSSGWEDLTKNETVLAGDLLRRLSIKKTKW